MRVGMLACLLVLGTASSSWAQPEFRFRQLSSVSDLELNPLGDHYRVHFQVRALQMGGKKGFARVVVKPLNDTAVVHETTSTFAVTDADETWQFALRVPAYQEKAMNYTIFAGVADENRVEEFTPSIGFRWNVLRTAAGGAALQTEEGGEPLPIRVRVRQAVPGNDGIVRVFSEVKIITQGPLLKLQQVISQTPIDGADTAKRLQ